MADTPATSVRTVDGPRLRQVEPTPKDAVPETDEAGRARLALQLLDVSSGAPPDDDGAPAGSASPAEATAGAGGAAGAGSGAGSGSGSGVGAGSASGSGAAAHAVTGGSRRVGGPDLLALQRFAGNRAVAGVAPRRRPGPPRSVQRAPIGETTMGEPQTAGVAASDPRVAEPVDPVALEIAASGVDEAAAILANGIKDNAGEHVIFGLQPTFLIVYGKDGKRVSGRIALKMPEGVRPAQGVYVIPPGGSVSRRVMVDPSTLNWSEGAIAGIVTETKKKPGATGATPATAPATPPATDTPAPAGGAGADSLGQTGPTAYDLRTFMADTGALEAAVAGREKAAQWFVIPSYRGSGKGKPGAEKTSGFVGELSEGGSGPPPNAEPWPVTLDGPKMQPTDSTGSFDAKIDWSANGNSRLANQVFSAVGTDIHYRWEVFDVTAFAQKQAAKVATQARQTQALVAKMETAGVGGDTAPVLAADPTAAPAGAAPSTSAPAAPAEDDYDQKLDELKRSKKGTGTEVTGREAANKAFKDDFRNLWKDTKRAGGDLADGKGDTPEERRSNADANLTALALMPVSGLVTTIGASLRWAADLFAGERKQMEIPWEREGTYLVRVVTTPRVGEDREGNKVIRPSSVASVVVQVVKTERMVKEALDAPAANVAEAEAELAKAQAAKVQDAASIAELQAQVEMARLRASGDPAELLRRQLEVKKKELAAVRAKWEGHAVGPILKVENEIEALEDRLAIYELQESRRTGGETTLAPPVRLNASLISEVTGQTYPLVISAGPMADEGGRKRWKVLDATSKDSEGYVGYGDTESGALRRALEKLGEKAQYGRGTIGVRVPDSVGLERGAQRDLRIESQPAGWAIARGRIDDLVMTLAALGLFVASAGTGAAVIGAAVAAARLIERLHNGTLRHFDAGVVSDVLAIMGGLGVAAQAAAGLRLQQLGKNFVMLEEGAATQSQLSKAAKLLEGAADLAKKVELANEALNYAGLIWGNVTFINDMMEIAASEADGSMTHAEARRRRAMAIGGAINNNGMFIAGNIIKAKQARKQAEARGTAEGGAVPHDGVTPADGATTGETKPSDTTKPAEGTRPAEGGGLVGETKAGTVGKPGGTKGPAAGAGGGGEGGPGLGGAGEGGTGAGGRPVREPTPQARRAAAHKALTDAATGAEGDLSKAAAEAIGNGTWKGDLKKAIAGLEGPQRVAAEKALVDARDSLVNDAWAGIAKDYPDLWLENAGTRSFGSDIDATVRPKAEATGTGGDMGGQVKRAAEAAQRLSDALRGKVGGETDAQIDTNIYSFIGEGRVKASDAHGEGAQQHVDQVVGLAEQRRGQGEKAFRDFEQRLAKSAGDPRVAAEAKALLAEARKFHDARQAEWADARAKAKQAMKGEPAAAVDRAARETLLGQKKAELAAMLADPAPDFGKIAGKQAEINWFAPDAYATPSAFKQAVAHGQRLKGSGRTAADLTGTEVAGKLREAAGKLPPESPRAQQLARDAARVESQQRLLDMTVRELTAEQTRSPMDNARVKELEQRAGGLRDAIARAAEPLVIGELLGSTMPSDKPSAKQLSESAAAAGANLGMLEDHVAHARDVDGKVKAACKYAGRIAMAEFLGGLRPDMTSTVGKLLGDFVQGRWGIMEDLAPQIMRDLFLKYAEATGRQKDIVRDAQGIPIGVTDPLKTKFVADVKAWARATNQELQTSAIGSKAFDNPASLHGPAGEGGTAPAKGGDGGSGTPEVGPSPGAKPGGEGDGTAPRTDEGASGARPDEGTGAGRMAPPDKAQVGPVPDEAGGTAKDQGGGGGPVPTVGGTPAGGRVAQGANTPELNPPGYNREFAFRLGTLEAGHEAMRRLSRGDPGILAEHGVTVPAGYEPHGTEFGLARMPDGSFAIVQGGPDGVSWRNLPPGTVPLAHTHPMTAGRELNAPGTVGDIIARRGASPIGGGVSPQTLDRTHVMPSAGDLRFCAANRVANHDVHTPYVHTGDGVLKNPTGAPGEIPVSFNISEARHMGNLGANPVVEAGLVAHDANGNVLWIGRIWGMELAGDSMVFFEPPTGLDPPDPQTLRAGLPGVTPAGTGGSGSGSGSGSGGPSDATPPRGTAAATAKGGGFATEIPGGITIEDDGIATWVKARRNPSALVRIESDGETHQVTDLYKRDLPEGSGTIMLAEGLRAVHVGPGTEIIVGEVLNPETKAAYDAHRDPRESKLGRTTERALAMIGLTVASMEWNVRRGKLTIVVKVG